MIPVAFELLRLLGIEIQFTSCVSVFLFLLTFWATQIVLAVLVLAELGRFWPLPLVQAERYDYLTTLDL